MFAVARSNRLAVALRSLLMTSLVAGLCTITACGDDNLDAFNPEIRFTPDALDFGEVAVGASSEADLTVINDGNAPIQLDQALTFTGGDVAAFTLINTPQFPLAGGQFTTVRVRFTPVEERSTTSSLRLPLSDPLELTTVAVGGIGIRPPIALAPAIVDFGSVDAGQSATQTIQVTNESDDRLSVTLSVASPSFLFTTGISTVVALEGGATQDVQLFFSPPGAGVFEGSLVAETCGPRCGPALNLQGEGLAPRISATPRPVAFGDVSVGEVGEVTLTLSNVGVGPLVISRVQLSDDLGAATIADAFDQTALPLVIEPGIEVALPLEYAPVSPNGDFSTTLLIDSNDPLSPRVAIPISATTPGAAIRVFPAALHFGRLDAGEERSLEVLLRSTGTDVAYLEQIDLVGDAPEAFTLEGVLPSLPVALAPQESILLSVRASARAADVANAGASATIRFTAEGSTGITETAMTFASGDEGCQPRARPDNLALGNLRVGQGATGRLEIVNEGNGPCTLISAAPSPGLPFDVGYAYQSLGLDVLAPGERGWIQFAYQAGFEGAASAFVRLVYEEQPAPLLVSSSARGVAGSLVAEPASITLGPVIEGCSTDQGVVSLVNDGAGDVTILSLEISPDPGAIRLATNFSAPRVVAPGGVFEVNLVSDSSAVVGLHQATIFADTEEVGSVTARAELTVEPPDVLLTEQFTIGDRTNFDVDILVVVDSSGSMGDDQQTLATNFVRFIDSAFLNASGNDFHLGVTTTDASDLGRLVGSPAYMTSSTGNLNAEFSARALVGTNGSPYEVGLETMRLALSNANPGFLRPAAALSVIIISDEDDAGGSGQISRTAQSYVQFLRSLKAGQLAGTPILVSAVVNLTDSTRYQAVADAFDGIVLDIRSPTWGERLGEIGEATVGLARLFRLANTPDEPTVTVTIDGVPETEFTVDVAGRAVILDNEPSPGAVVLISYGVDCLAAP